MKNTSKSNSNKIWHDDDSNWKWGIFYFNKQDNRIFPPKRNEMMGWTINFANPISILLFLILVSLLIAIPIYFR